MARAAFSSKIGFVMAAVGSAVGLGNLWRFPFLTATNGGATFVVIYLALLFLIAIPALMAELSLGRRSQRNAVDAYGEDGKRKPWQGAGYLALFTAMLLLSYYAVIAGWSIRYMLDGLRAITTPPAYLDDPIAYFGDISQGPDAIFAHLAFMAVTTFIVWRGVAKGIEKANLVMMPILFLTVIGLVIYANLQTGSAAGREFYLRPDFSELRGSTFTNAAGQTFFSVGLGIGTMLTYSSYLGRDTDLQRTGLIVGLSDTAVAILAGLMIFPLIFSLGLGELIGETGASTVGGLFIAVPSAFGAMDPALGSLLATVFFIMLTFAALSSGISLLEVPVSHLIDRFPHWGRARAVLVLAIPIYVFGLLSALSTDFLGNADALVSRVLLLAGGLLLTIYVGWVRRDVLYELENGLSGFSMGGYFRPVIRYVVPVLLAGLLLLGVLGLLFDYGLLQPAEGTTLHQLLS